MAFVKFTSRYRSWGAPRVEVSRKASLRAPMTEPITRLSAALADRYRIERELGQGWSNRPNWRGGIVYLQGPADTRARYFRVIPHWVTRMKRAVDEANR